MGYKLTLSIDKKVSEQAKVYARKQGRSLSDLVENYLKSITTDQEEGYFSVSPKIKALRGVLKVPEDFDYKAELSDELEKKYLK